MERLKEIISSLLKNPGKALLVLLLIAAVLVLGYLFLWYIVLPLLGLALFVWLMLECPVPEGLFVKAPALPALQNVSMTLINWAYIVTVQLCGNNALSSPIRTPTGVSETSGSPAVVKVKGVSMLQFYIPLEMGKEDMPLNLPDVKEVVQAGFTNALNDGNLPDQPYMPDSDDMPVPVVEFSGVPIVYIADIRRERLRLVVTAHWVNNQWAAFKVKHLRGKQSGGGGGGVDSTERNY
jgi:hypothetical protein